MTAWLLLLACNKDGPTEGDSGSVVQTCEAFSEVEADVLPLGTVVVLRTETDTAGPVSVDRIQVGDAVYTDRPSDTESGTAHEITVYGLPALTEIQVDLALDDCVQTVIFETGSPSETFPFITDALETGELGSGGWFPMTVFTEDVQYSAILASDGTPVWWRGHDLVLTRTALSVDRETILFNTIAGGYQGQGFITRLELGGGERAVYEVPGHHTDFVERPDGTVAALVYDIEEVDGSWYQASAVVEIAPDGTQTMLFRLFDQAVLDTGIGYPESTVHADGVDVMYEWMHLNSISWSESEQAYLLTEGNAARVMQVSADGELDWIVGHHVGEIHTELEDSVQAPHKAVRIDGGGVVVFNRGDRDSGAEQCAFVTTLEVDGVGATETNRVTPEDCLKVTFLGEAQNLADDKLFVNYSSAGVLELLGEDLEPELRLTTNLGAAFGFGEYAESLYR
ncbi:MAG: hypothetical protein GY913_13820 [Proteobacteria bacterium]|nr:hypothetical protein [Pseudomonadota bacterium]MCP4917986.1 hypothetical protein [Pseudomonadota bacterium]